MTRRDNFLIFFLSLAFALGIASTQSTPGYMDADYYYATGIQLAQGEGFTEPFLWNYLEDADGLPHPSHAYWMPLASILSAAGMRLTRGYLDAAQHQFDFASAQMAFIFLSALVPLITAHLAFSLTQKRNLALISALLALFSGYYAPFLTTTDTFSLYMVLGGSFLLALKIERIWLKAIILGFLSALFHLSRADGAVWLIIAAISLFLSLRGMERRSNPFLSSFLFLFSSYLLIITPWLLRNYTTFGTPLAPNGDQMLWLTTYDQIFAYPAGNLSLQTWLASGWGEIIKARLWALQLNLGTILGVQGGIILLPFIIIGAWKQIKQNHPVPERSGAQTKGGISKRDSSESIILRLQAQKQSPSAQELEYFLSQNIISTGILAWLTTLIVMTLIFPFAGARGGFFHSGAALQPLWWALAPIGLERVVAWMVAHRDWQAESLKVFSAILVAMSLLLTGAIMWMRALSPMARDQAQNTGVPLYASIEKRGLSQEDVEARAAVIVSNPPGYFLASRRPAIVLPDGDLETIFALAERYGAEFLILEKGSVTEGLMPLFDNPLLSENLVFLEEIEGAKIFVIETK